MVLKFRREVLVEKITQNKMTASLKLPNVLAGCMQTQRVNQKLSEHCQDEFLCCGTLFFLTETQQVLTVLFLSMVILWGQIEADVFHSVDGIIYSLVAKELTQKPLINWVVLTWNQAPFFEHPHLTPWLLAIFMKAFGVHTLTAIIPIVLLSNLTVLLTYFLGKRFLDHRFGILAATVLTFTPQFVKNGRNPMLEPALMLSVMLVIFFYIKSVQDKKFIPTLIAGFFLG